MNILRTKISNAPALVCFIHDVSNQSILQSVLMSSLMCVISYNHANIQCFIDSQGVQALLKIFAAFPFVSTVSSAAGMNVAMLCKDTPQVKDLVRAIINYSHNVSCIHSVQSSRISSLCQREHPMIHFEQYVIFVIIIRTIKTLFEMKV